MLLCCVAFRIFTSCFHVFLQLNLIQSWQTRATVIIATSDTCWQFDTDQTLVDPKKQVHVLRANGMDNGNVRMSECCLLKSTIWEMWHNMSTCLWWNLSRSGNSPLVQVSTIHNSGHSAGFLGIPRGSWFHIPNSSGLGPALVLHWH